VGGEPAPPCPFPASGTDAAAIPLVCSSPFRVFGTDVGPDRCETCCPADRRARQVRRVDRVLARALALLRDVAAVVRLQDLGEAGLRVLRVAVALGVAVGTVAVVLRRRVVAVAALLQRHAVRHRKARLLQLVSSRRSAQNASSGILPSVRAWVHLLPEDLPLVPICNPRVGPAPPHTTRVRLSAFLLQVKRTGYIPMTLPLKGRHEI